jgi:hypothetical protein
MTDAKIIFPKNYITLSNQEKIEYLESIIEQARGKIAELEDKIENEDNRSEDEKWDDAMNLLYPNADAEEREEVLFDRFAKGD